MANENYVMGYSAGSLAIMSSRTAQSHAAFFLTKLSKGMSVLDIGCGPGTVTLGFAEAVFPGHAIGSELSLEQTEQVATKAQSQGLNLRFESANVYDLPYPDAYFDAVFMSAVVGNVQQPAQAFMEIFRVLKPDGIVGVKEFDLGANIAHPHLPFYQKSNELHRRLRIENGHDPDSGRKVRGYLNSAGFDEIQANAVFHTLPSQSISGDPISESIMRDEWGPEFIKYGWVTQQEVDEMIAQSQTYTPGPDHFFAMAWIEALGKRPT